MPNAGKSTLYNALMGDSLAIVNEKAQTTRHRILGIRTTEDFQIIYSDTPGILRKMSYKMHETMMKTVRESLEDSDVIVLLIDIQNPSFSEDIQTKFNKFTGKKIVCLNKIDTINQEKLEAGLLQIKEQFAADFYLPISAKEKFQVDRLEQQVLEYLPVHPPYFDGEDVTDRSERFFVNEIIRNNILKLYSDEIPYSSEVHTLSFKEDVKIIRMSCEIIVERDSQKRIVVGSKGAGIKQLGIQSRKELEAFFGKQIFIELFIKVRDNWRNNANMLKQFGYEGD